MRRWKHGTSTPSATSILARGPATLATGRAPHRTCSIGSRRPSRWLKPLRALTVLLRRMPVQRSRKSSVVSGIAGASATDSAALCRKITKLGFWPEGWLAVRQTLDFDGKGMAAERLAQTSRRSNRTCGQRTSRRKCGPSCCPRDCRASTSRILRSTRARIFRREWREPKMLARHLGKAVATEEAILSSLLPSLVSSDGRLWSFGEGLSTARRMQRAVGSPCRRTQCDRSSLRKPQVLCGF